MYGVKRLAWIVLLAAYAHAAAEPHDDLLTLYTQARASNPTLQRAVALAGSASAGADGARAALLPQWTLSATPQRIAGVTTNTATSQINQALVNHAAIATWQAARADASAQEASLRAAEQALLAEVAVRYFALLTAQNQLATLAANEAAFAELVRQSEVRVAERLSAQVDVDQARAFFGLAQGTAQQAKEALADARQAMQQLTGQQPLPLKPLQQGWHPAAPLRTSPAAWVAEAMTGHPLLHADSASVAAAQERIEAARSANLPTLGLAVTTERAPLAGLPTSTQTTYTSVGLQLTIPLFAGGATFARQKQATYSRDAEAAQLEATRRDLVRNVEAQWQAAQGSVSQIATAEVAAVASERALAATRVGQQQGTRSLTDVLNAIQTRGQTQLQLSQARHRHVVALLLLKQSVGRLSIDDLANVNAQLEGSPHETEKNAR